MSASRLASDPASSLEERLEAAKRAIPLARMTDYGLAADDANLLLALVPDDGLEWWSLAEVLAERHVKQARRYADAGYWALSRLEHERAAAAFNIGQLAIHRDDEIKRDLYVRGSACLKANTREPGCDYRRVTLPADAGHDLYAWEFPLLDPIGRVVMFGGLSGWGASFFEFARALGRQGIAVTLVEAPGQGETRLTAGLHLSRETLSQAMAFVDFAAIGGKPVGLVGFSFGGLIAAHLAAAAPIVRALCTNGSPVAVGALDHPAEREQFGAAFGTDGDELLRRVRDFAFDPSTEVLRCPVLSLEGGADPLVPPGTWRGFFGEQQDNATAVVWEDGLHTLYNHAGERDALIAAWFADCFRQATDQ